jgi:hypothetical protein
MQHDLDVNEIGCNSRAGLPSSKNWCQPELENRTDSNQSTHTCCTCNFCIRELETSSFILLNALRNKRSASQRSPSGDGYFVSRHRASVAGAFCCRQLRLRGARPLPEGTAQQPTSVLWRDGGALGFPGTAASEGSQEGAGKCLQMPLQ